MGIYADGPMTHTPERNKTLITPFNLRNAVMMADNPSKVLFPGVGWRCDGIGRAGIDSMITFFTVHQTNYHALRQLPDAGKGSGHSEHLIPPRSWQCFL